MKKILIAMASIVVAGMVNAAAFTWSTNISSSMGPLYVAGGSTTLASGTAYLFDSLALSQQDVLDAFVAGSFSDLSSLDNSDISSGMIAAKSASPVIYGDGATTLSAFLAVVNEDQIFISDIVSAAGLATGTKGLSFKTTEASKLEVMDARDGYSTSGWYQTVPEPTSGLLILLGMAGLALRRRRT